MKVKAFVFFFFHILVFTLILCLSFACCWNFRDVEYRSVPVTVIDRRSSSQQFMYNLEVWSIDQQIYTMLPHISFILPVISFFGAAT
jgi:hypothetical protein